MVRGNGQGTEERARQEKLIGTVDYLGQEMLWLDDYGRDQLQGRYYYALVNLMPLS